MNQVIEADPIVSVPVTITMLGTEGATATLSGTQQIVFYTDSGKRDIAITSGEESWACGEAPQVELPPAPPTPAEQLTASYEDFHTALAAKCAPLSGKNARSCTMLLTLVQQTYAHWAPKLAAGNAAEGPPRGGPAALCHERACRRSSRAAPLRSP